MSKSLLELLHMLDVEVGMSKASAENKRTALAEMQILVDGVVKDLDSLGEESEDPARKLAAAALKATLISSVQDQARILEQTRGHASGLNRAMELVRSLIKDEEDEEEPKIFRRKSSRKGSG